MLENFANSTTLHGVPRIIHAKRWYVRMSWMILFLSALAMFGFQLSQLFVKYYKYDKQISIEIRQLNESELPWITVCFPQTFDSLVLRQLYDLFTYNQMERELMIRQVNNRFIDFFNYYYENFTVEEINFAGVFFNEVLNDLDRSLVDEGIVKFDYYIKNDEKFLIVRKTYYPYPCMTLQFRKNLVYGTKPYSFQLKIFSGHTLKPTKNMRSKTSIGVRQIFDSFVERSNVQVFIHSPYSVAYEMNARYIPVAPNQYMSFVVNTRKMERLEHPYGSCTQVYPFRYYPEGIYVQKVCNLCIQVNKFIDKHKCKFNVMQNMDIKHINEVPNCSPYKELLKATNFSRIRIETIIAHYLNMRKLDHIIKSELSSDTHGICPRSCEEYKYDVEITTKKIYYDNLIVLNHLLTGYVEQLIRFNETERLRLYGINVTTAEQAKILGYYDNVQMNNTFRKRLLEELLILEFEMKTDEITITKENPVYTFVQLLSDIGGQLGLWIGMSIVTAFELLNMVFKFIKMMWTKLVIIVENHFLDIGLTDVTIRPNHQLTTSTHDNDVTTVTPLIIVQ